MKRGLVIGVLCAVLAAAGVGVAALSETPVLAGAKNERNPAADMAGATTVLAFTRSRSGDRNRYDAWAQEGSDAPVKLNANGQAWTGGIDYPIVPYQQVNSSQSDIWLYDLSTDTTIRQLAPVSTDKWEWHPTFSGDLNDYHLLFGRDNLSSPRQRVVLHHHTTTGTHEDHLLAEVTKASHYLQPDQVNDDWATYTKCTPNCNVFLHQISTEETTKLAKPVRNRPRQQYAAGVSPDGAVYFIRSGPRCGEKVKIVRYDPAHSDPTFGTVLAAVPSGVDIAFAFLHQQVDGTRDLYYDRVNCSTGRFDVYKVTDPAGP
jgi:hypothetical protein